MNTIKLVALILASALIGALVFQFTQPENTDTIRDAESKSTAATQDASPGVLRPSFTLPDLEDQPRNINEWDGKLLLINFWASWCPPCIKEMPALDALRLQYQAQNFEILGVAIEPAADVSLFLDNSPVSYPIVYGEIEADRIAKQYGNTIGSIPFSVLIDQNGMIIEQYFGEIDIPSLEQTLLSLI